MPKILLVDDSMGNRMTLGSLLEDEGLDVDLAESFAQGREKLCAGAASYDVVMLDLHLGDGLGTNLVPTVRARMPRAKVMLMSGSSEPDALPADGSFDAVLEKGGDFDEVVATIRKLIEPPGPR